MEGSRSDRAAKFANTHATARCKTGKSQEYMAMELGVSKKTIQNWENGTSSPTFFQSLEWFRALNMNPFPHYLKLVYPEKMNGLKGTDSDEKINEAFDALAETLPISARRALLFLFYGEHGGSPNAVIQLMLAHLHTSLPSRIAQATLAAHMFEMEKELDNLICKDNIMPDMDVLNDAIIHAKLSAICQEYGYSIISDEKEKGL